MPVLILARLLASGAEGMDQLYEDAKLPAHSCIKLWYKLVPVLSLHLLVARLAHSCTGMGFIMLLKWVVSLGVSFMCCYCNLKRYHSHSSAAIL